MNTEQFYEVFCGKEECAEISGKMNDFADKVEALLEEADEVTQEDFGKFCDEAKANLLITDEEMRDIVDLLVVLWGDGNNEQLIEWYKNKDYAVEDAGTLTLEDLVDKYINEEVEDEADNNDIPDSGEETEETVEDEAEATPADEAEATPETVLDPAAE